MIVTGKARITSSDPEIDHRTVGPDAYVTFEAGQVHGLVAGDGAVCLVLVQQSFIDIDPDKWDIQFL